MALLEWKPEFSAGIEAVDHEHRQLIDQINQLHGGLAAGSGKDAVEGFFGDLLELITAHFALEETFMREKRYDQLPSHKDDHERLLDEIRDIMDDFVEDRWSAQEVLVQRLHAWFSRHFETHDARLHKALGPH
ncbi:MAG: hemerythrin family protein [Hyphomicrobiales bacterium]|nr:hemerythrin family protein [Hyphomicrobiales bacterium]